MGRGSTKVLGVLGGGDMPPALLAAWASSADLIVAADSGADRLLAVGARPHVIIGDLDSLTSEARALPIPILYESDQDSTDADKLCAYVLSEGYQSVTLICVEGDMYDHVLGILRTSAATGLQVRLALRKGVADVVRAGGPVTLPARVGERVSLIGLHDCVVDQFIGVKWPLSNVELNFQNLQSISNEVSEDAITVQLRSGVALLHQALDPTEMPRW